MINKEYSSTRLLFRADIIELLNDDDTFTVVTPEISFRMTKSDFYRVFSNVVKSKSYKEKGIYNYHRIPNKALQFQTMNIVSNTIINTNVIDLVGDEIREKIKEIGSLWRQSEHNPRISAKILNQWHHLLEEWIEDENMPLIIRKETNKRGQSFIHPSGREIIISDNTFAIWIYGCVLKEIFFSISDIKKKLQNNDIPMVYISTKEIKTKAKYTKALGINPLAGWKLSHIEPVGFNNFKSIMDIEISVIKQQFLKYTSPKNMFILPKEIGYLGEIREFI